MSMFQSYNKATKRDPLKLQQAVMQEAEWERNEKAKANAQRNSNLGTGASIYNKAMGDSSPIADYLRNMGNTPESAQNMDLGLMEGEGGQGALESIDAASALPEPAMDLGLGQGAGEGALSSIDAAGALPDATAAVGQNVAADVGGTAAIDAAAGAGAEAIGADMLGAEALGLAAGEGGAGALGSIAASQGAAAAAPAAAAVAPAAATAAGGGTMSSILAGMGPAGWAAMAALALKDMF